MFIKLNKKGFTLVEIMIVVAIIGLLAAIAIPNFIKARKTARKNICISNLRTIYHAMEEYMIDNNLAAAATIPSAGLFGDNEYIKTEPRCPEGSTAAYTGIAVAGSKPACPNVTGFGDHVLP